MSRIVGETTSGGHDCSAAKRHAVDFGETWRQDTMSGRWTMRFVIKCMLALSETTEFGCVEQELVEQRGDAAASRVPSQDQDRRYVAAVLGELANNDVEHLLCNGGHSGVGCELQTLERSIVIEIVQCQDNTRMAHLGSNFKGNSQTIEVDSVIESQGRAPNGEGSVLVGCDQSPILGVLSEGAGIAAHHTNGIGILEF